MKTKYVSAIYIHTNTYLYTIYLESHCSWKLGGHPFHLSGNSFNHRQCSEGYIFKTNNLIFYY